MHKEKINIEDFKELVDSRKKSKDEKNADSLALLNARRESFENSNSADQMVMHLYRLKLMLEEEAKTEELTSKFHTYSSTYVDLLYKTRKSFASDIGFSETQVSLILSGRRPATEEFVSKIRTHSSKIYQKINIDFNSLNWFTVYHLDKMHDYLNTHKKDKVSLKNINNIIMLYDVK